MKKQIEIDTNFAYDTTELATLLYCYDYVHIDIEDLLELLNQMPAVDKGGK